MSIMSELAHRRITFSQAIAQTVDWASHLPGAAQAGTDVMGDLKQAASDAVSFADGAAGVLIGDGAAALETLVGELFAKLGPAGTALTPLVDAGLDQVAGILKAAVDAEAAKVKAALAGTAQAPA